MKKLNGFAKSAVAVILVLSVTGCGGMTTREKNTAIGAGVGAAAGAVLTGGGLLGTVGGAALGGVVGHEIDK